MKSWTRRLAGQLFLYCWAGLSPWPTFQCRDVTLTLTELDPDFKTHSSGPTLRPVALPENFHGVARWGQWELEWHTSSDFPCRHITANHKWRLELPLLIKPALNHTQLWPPHCAHWSKQVHRQVSPYISSVLWISAIRRSSFSECLGKNWNLEQ